LETFGKGGSSYPGESIKVDVPIGAAEKGKKVKQFWEVGNGRRSLRIEGE